MEKLNKENFNDFISCGKVLVDFNASWCGPCNMLRPILEELEGILTDIKFGSVNVDDNEYLARNYGVMSIPTLILFNDGNIVKQNIGFISKDDLIDWLNK